MSNETKNPAEILRDAGREHATNMLSQAVKSAKNSEQINNHLYLLDCMAVHILATNVYNRLKNFDDKSQTALIMECKELIEEEIQSLFDNESNMTTLKPE